MLSGTINTVYIELTTRCNLRCVHCFQEHNPGDVLPTATALKIIELADSLGASQLVLTGGEPMLHPDFAEIYERARSHGLIVKLFTNGLVIPPQNWEVLKKMPPHMVEITVYGTDPKMLKLVTQRNVDLDRVKTNVRRYQQLGSPVYLKWHAMTVSREGTGPFIELAKELECDWGVNVQIIPMRNGDQTPVQYRLSGESIKQLEQEHGLDFLGDARDGEDLRGCTLGEQIYVTAEGRLQGCPIFVKITEKLVPDRMEQQVYQISKAGAQIRQVQELSNGVCPAWLHLEGTEKVESFLASMGAEGL